MNSICTAHTGTSDSEGGLVMFTGKLAVLPALCLILQLAAMGCGGGSGGGGSNTSGPPVAARQLPDVVEGVNVGFGLALVLPAHDPGGSDQASFLKRGVPALQVFTGANPDYHRPSDTPDKIDYAGLEEVAGFTAELVLYLAERVDPLTFVPPGAADAAPPPGPPRAERRVSFGSIPDFAHEGAGILLTGVIPGSPADQAGLRAGDLIVSFSGVAIDDLQGFSDVLRSLDPGDSVEVVYERDGERRTVASTVVERK